MVAYETLLYPLYAETNQEAHRRSATLITTPTVTSYSSFYYPRNADELPSLIEAVLLAIGFKNPETQAPNIAHMFSEAIFDDYEMKENRFIPSVPLIYDTEIRFGPTIDSRVRIEFHREYFSIAIFCPLRAKLCPIEQSIQFSLGNCQDCIPKKIVLGSKDYVSELLNYLYKDCADFLRIEIDKVAKGIRDWIEREPTRRTDQPELFCNFYGVMMPWTFFGPSINPANKPIFPEPDTYGVVGDKSHESGSSASAFLRNLWESGLAETGHLVEKQDDFVACFMQRGHNIYISAVGKQKRNGFGELYQDPLTYLVLHHDDHQMFELSESLSVMIPSFKVSGDLDRKLSWQHSRFLGRLHDLGVARLAGLRNLYNMKKFNHFLRGIENRIQTLERENPNSKKQLDEIEDLIERKIADLGEPVLHRSLRASYYLRQMKDITLEMEIVNIPGFQDYLQFTRRYLYQSVENISAIGPRYTKVMESIENFLSISNSSNLLKVQRIADLAAGVIVIYYLMNIPLVFSKNFGTLGLENWITEETGAAISIAVGIASYLVISNRVYKVIEEIVSEAVSKKTNGVFFAKPKDISLWAAKLFALPIIIMLDFIIPMFRYTIKFIRSNFP